MLDCKQLALSLSKGPFPNRSTFYDDQLTAVRADDGHIYVSVRHMCDALGLSRQAQMRRINRHAVLSEGMQGGAILAPPSADGRGGGRQQTNTTFDELLKIHEDTPEVQAFKMLQGMLQLARNQILIRDQLQTAASSTF